MVNVRRALAESNRIEAFSDGVLAVGITLLVLDLRAPEGRGEFMHEVLRQWPAYAAYAAAFLFIGTVWISHHAMFSRIRRVDSRLIVHNLLHLMLASSIPFATAIASNALREGNRSDQLVAVFVFGTTMIALCLSWYLFCRYVELTPDLLEDAADVAAVHHDRVRQPFLLIVPVGAMLIGLANPEVSLTILGLVPVLIIVFTFYMERNSQRSAQIT